MAGQRNQTASGGFGLPEDRARQVYLLRAVEAVDSQQQLLTAEDRAQADHHGQAAARLAGGKPEDYLAARAEFATARMAVRHPAIARVLARSGWPGWISWAVPLAALIAGFVSNELDGGRRLELLAVPLIGVILWNLAVYLALLLRPLWRRRSGQGGLIARTVTRWLTMPPDFAGGSALAGAVTASFGAEWIGASKRVTGHRIETVMHLGAAMFALGLIGAIFLRALTVEYRAGWESTFLGAGQVQAILNTVLAPAAWLTEIALPTASEMAALRWPGGQGAVGGAIAGPWIVLWTVTLALVAVIPRLLLAAVSAIASSMAARRVPVPGREDFATRRLLRAMEGHGGHVRVTPYAYTPDERTIAALGQVLRASLGPTARIDVDPPVIYGDEDRWLAAAALSPDVDLHLVLFSLSATPEAENHGAFVAGLTSSLQRGAPGVRSGVIVDEAPFARQFAGQGGLDTRRSGRVQAWEALLQPLAVPNLFIDLAAADSTRLAPTIESALLGAGLNLEAV